MGTTIWIHSCIPCSPEVKLSLSEGHTGLRPSTMFIQECGSGGFGGFGALGS